MEPGLERLSIPGAPAPRGAFSAAVRAGSLLFVAGQRGIDPATGRLVAEDIRARARRTLENLRLILEGAGSDTAHVVATTVYLRDLMAGRPIINELYEEFFGPHRPARTLVEVSRLAQDDLVEISAVALIPGGS